MADRFQSFDEFWPYYVSEHAHPACRALHYIGTTNALVFALITAITANPWFLLAIPLSSYSCAWVGHFFIEKNRPATFTYPLWSLLGDFKMYGLFLTGRMKAEVDKVTGLSA